MLGADNLFRAFARLGIDAGIDGHEVRVYAGRDAHVAVRVVRGKGAKLRFTLHRCVEREVESEVEQSEWKLGELEDWRDVVVFVRAYLPHFGDR